MPTGKPLESSDKNITKLGPNEIFVFGSNLAGIHGRGAAKAALKFGATYGIGEGLSFQTYGIPTKGRKLEILPAYSIGCAVARFLKFAASRPDLRFLVTPIGCGLAGYSPKEIAPMFQGATPNVILPSCFQEWV